MIFLTMAARVADGLLLVRMYVYAVCCIYMYGQWERVCVYMCTFVHIYVYIYMPPYHHTKTLTQSNMNQQVASSDATQEMTETMDVYKSQVWRAYIHK